MNDFARHHIDKFAFQAGFPVVLTILNIICLTPTWNLVILRTAPDRVPDGKTKQTKNLNKKAALNVF